MTTLVQLSKCHAVKEASYLLPGGKGRWWIGGIKAITVPLQKTAQGGKGGFLQVHAEWPLPGYHVPEQNVIFISKFKSNRKSRHSHTHMCINREVPVHTHTHLTQGIPEHTHERLRVCRHTTVHKTEDLVPAENIQQVMYTMAALPRAPISKCFKEVPGTPCYIF